MTNNILATLYKGPAGKKTKSEANVKDLGVVLNEILKFKEHTGKIVLSSQVIGGIIIITFTTREKANDKNVQFINTKHNKILLHYIVTNQKSGKVENSVALYN